MKEICQENLEEGELIEQLLMLQKKQVTHAATPWLENRN